MEVIRSFRFYILLWNITSISANIICRFYSDFHVKCLTWLAILTIITKGPLKIKSRQLPCCQPKLLLYVLVLIYNRRLTSSKHLATSHFLKIVILTFYKVMSYFTAEKWLGSEKTSGPPPCPPPPQPALSLSIVDARLIETKQAGMDKESSWSVPLSN